MSTAQRDPGRGVEPTAGPTTRLSRRAQAVADSVTLAVTAKARELRAAGHDVVNFGAGEPDFDTPDFIKQAAHDALDAGLTKYTPNPCIPELRRAIVEKFGRDNGLEYGEKQVTVGPGGKGALILAMLALLDEGEEVIFPAPYWVSYPEQVKICGGVPKVLLTREEDEFKLTPQQLDGAIGSRTRLFILNSPNNPCGNCYSPAELRELAAVLLRHPQVIVLSDEIYEKLIYGGQETASIAAVEPRLSDRTLTFNCHSKSFSMTGWRLGYCGGPANVIAAMNKLQGQINSHVTSFTQPAAALALTDPRGAEATEQMRRQFEERGERMWRRLAGMPGLTCIRPRGAFYCFPNVSAYFGRSAPGGGTIRDAVDFSAALLESQQVAIVPGNDSGLETHVRLSFACSLQDIDKGLGRFEAFLGSLS